MEPLIFKLNPESYPAVRKKFIIQITLLMIVVWGAVSFSILKDDYKNGWGTAVWFMLGLALFYVYLIFRIAKKRKKLYDSYALVIDDINITRKQEGFKDVQILISEVSIIEKNASNRLTIRGISNVPFERIVIPSQVGDYDRVEETLAGIKSLTINTKPNYLEKYGLLIIIILVAPIVGVYVVDNKIVVGICAVIAVTLLVYNIFYMLKYKNTVKSWKRALWLYPLIVISILVVAYFKLIA
jgi:hypothetical protein